MANIRAKFASNSSMSDYDKKKYVWKLVYIYLLGYPVDIGHMMALGMIGSKSPSVKAVGYIACSVLFTEKSELLRLVIQSIKQDLASTNDVYQSLALTFIGVIGNAEFAESLTNDVQRLLFNPNIRPVIRKKAVLAFLRLVRKNPDIVPLDDTEFDAKAIRLLDDGNIGVLTSVCSLLLALASIKTSGYDAIVPKATGILFKVRFADPNNRSVYKYYNTICPWLQVKILKLLQYFPAQCGNIASERWKPTNDQASSTQRLFHSLSDILTRTLFTKNMNKNNGDHSILFEACRLIIQIARTAQNNDAPVNEALDSLISSVSTLMAKFISSPEANYRYLGLDTMSKLSLLSQAIPTIRVHQEVVLNTLKDNDETLRKRAIDVLYSICDQSSVENIVQSMIDILPVEENRLIKQDLLLKVFVLAEKFHKTYEWYIDTSTSLLLSSGEYITPDIWYRIVQIITNNESLQLYAVTKCYEMITDPKNQYTIAPLTIQFLVYVLGEFSWKSLNDSPEGSQTASTIVNPSKLFESLHHQFKLTMNGYTRCIILCSYAKLAFTFPELQPQIDNVFNQCSSSLDEELQQRAVEFRSLLQQDSSLLEVVLDVMPQFEVTRDLDDVIHKSSKLAADRDVWTQPEPDVVTQIDNEDDTGVDDAQYAERQHVESNNAVVELVPVEGYGDQPPYHLLSSTRNPQGEIYNSTLLSIYVKVSAEGSVAKMIFTVHNKASYEISNVALILPNVDVVRVQAKPSAFPVIPPGGQEKFYVLWHSLKPFETPPPIRLSFTYLHQDASSTSPTAAAAPVNNDPFDLLGLFNDTTSPDTPQSPTQHQVPVGLTIRVPIFSTSFITPHDPIPGSDFLPRWKELGNQTVAKLQCANTSHITVPALLQLAQTHLHLTSITGCDTNPNNLYLYGVFNAVNKDTRQPITVDVMVRIETKPNLDVIRVTINSGSTAVSSAVMKAITFLLLAKVVDN